MPLICRIRPNRSEPRTFSAQDVARITCRAIQQGVERAEIDRRMSLICPDDARRPERDLAALAAQAAAVAQGNIDELNGIYNQFLLINGLLLGLFALITALSPLGRVIRPVLTAVSRTEVARTALLGFATRIQGRVAANESLYQNAVIALRRAA